MNDTTPEQPKLSWWRRLSSGLKRTSSSLGTAVADLVTKRKLDHAMLEDIEDVLLRADLGTEVAARISAAASSQRSRPRSAWPLISRAADTRSARLIVPSSDSLAARALSNWRSPTRAIRQASRPDYVGSGRPSAAAMASSNLPWVRRSAVFAFNIMR